MATPLASLLATRVVAVIRAPSAESAFQAAQAAYRGGVKALEITFTVPDADQVIARLARELPHALVGAGTIIDVAQAERARAAGACFAVSPHTDPRLIAWHLERGLDYVPGAMTPSELMVGYNAGARLLKVFPASAVGGPSFVKGVLAALPFLQLMTTGGVDEKTAPELIAAGARLVCVGGNIVSPAAIATGDWKSIEVACARVVASVTGPGAGPTRATAPSARA